MPTRRKPVPPAPDSLDRLHEVRAAVSLTPDPETTCCVRLVDRADVPARDEARTWLTFLRALALVEETERGYARTRDDPDPETLRDRYLDGVYGARELSAVLEAEGPLDADAAFERFREHVPEYERHRSDEWEPVWRERVGRLLEWGTLLGAVEHTTTGYDAF